MLFLLAAAPLGMGCPVTIDILDTDEVGDTDETDTDTSTDDEVGTESGTDTTDDTTDETTEESTDETTDESTDETTDESTDDTSDTSTDTTGEENACEGFSTQVADCFDLDPIQYYEDCVGNIEYGTQEYGPECGVAVEDYYACLSTLDCETLADEAAIEVACAEQILALEANCGG